MRSKSQALKFASVANRAYFKVYQGNQQPQPFYNSFMRAFATKIVQVPTMGDSISEGVIEEFVK
jgi:hypothetical protein